MDADGVGSVAAAVIAAAALIVAFRARSDSKRSADASDRSADASDRSAVAAERAAEITDLEARRRVERSHVEWERLRPDAHGVLRYRNVGLDVAKSVVVMLQINGERIEHTVGNVPGGASFEYNAAAYRARALEQYEERRADNKRSQGAVLQLPRLNVKARISWESELGTPGIVTL